MSHYGENEQKILLTWNFDIIVYSYNFGGGGGDGCGGGSMALLPPAMLRLLHVHVIYNYIPPAMLRLLHR